MESQASTRIPNDKKRRKTLLDKAKSFDIDNQADFSEKGNARRPSISKATDLSADSFDTD